ncbi:VanZ family protein [Brevibacillus sp. NRS-1366]|uniref:VanZ family protein n=1 Tax=Brevibacillus sp. NRS-1366 TaxID=3233899 RepID=UPI003D1F2E4B
MNNGRNQYVSTVMLVLLKYAIFALYLFMVIKVLLLKFGHMDIDLLLHHWQQGIRDPNIVLERLRNRGNLVPFHEIQNYVVAIRETGSWHSFVNLAGNVIAFLPLGFMLPLLFAKRVRSLVKVVFLSFLFSLGLEVTQLVTSWGTFDVDDIVLNTTGGALGYGFYLSYRLIFWWKSRKPQTLISEAH